MRSELQEGALVAGKYRIVRCIGKGAMGAVFLAEHTLLLQEVAIKVMRLGADVPPEAFERFLNEGRAASRIKSEYVARIHDLGLMEGGAPFMVLEYLEGADAKDVLEEGPLTPEHAADVILQACDVLAEAHEQGIIHRDLKPANLFLVGGYDRQASPRVKVLDFGVSKVMRPFGGGNKELTLTSDLMGSPRYMAPEQIDAARSVDARCDIWSLGVILYELLVGAFLFDGASIGVLFGAIMNRPIPAPSAKNPGLPAGLDAVVARCLERDRDARFATVQTLAAALEPFATPRGRAIAQRLVPALAAPVPSTSPRLGAPATAVSSAGAVDDTAAQGARPKRMAARWSVLALAVAALLAAALVWLRPRSAAAPVVVALSPQGGSVPTATPSPTDPPPAAAKPPEPTEAPVPDPPAALPVKASAPRPAAKPRPAPSASAAAPAPGCHSAGCGRVLETRLD